MQEALYSEGCKRITEYNLKKTRIIFNIGEQIQETLDINPETLIRCAIEYLESSEYFGLSKLSDMRKEMIVRDNQIGFYMNWHLDDCSVIKHNTTDKELHNNIVLNNKYSLFHMKNLPKYTMIIYLSSIDIDFCGGEFEFVDQLVKPKKYDVVFFDSREVHRVRTLRSGSRKNVLVKFFDS
jgi:hypothetical protein